MSQPTWIGRTLSGRYHIDELLGQGGMSAVYKATDPNLQRVVAIKIIHSHLSGDPDFIKRFVILIMMAMPITLSLNMLPALPYKTD